MTRYVVMVRIGPPFEITGHPYVANVGDVYSYIFGTTGGTAPITWTCSPNPVGASGLSFSAGVLSGTCAVGGVFNFTITATDANRQVATANFNLIIVGSAIFLITEANDLIITESGEPMIPQ
jgi:hypothetical protein